MCSGGALSYRLPLHLITHHIKLYYEPKYSYISMPIHAYVHASLAVMNVSQKHLTAGMAVEWLSLDPVPLS